MKTNKFVILLLLVVFCRCANDKITDDGSVVEVDENELSLTISSGACFPEVDGKYVYPVMPGTEEWNQAKYPDNPIRFCQLPDTILKSISTLCLIDALIHAPLFSGMYLLSGDASALKWHSHYELFNSASELFQREDAANLLVAYYKFARLDCVAPDFNVCSEYEKMMGLEILFTKQEMLDQMDHDKKKEAVAALLAKHKQYPAHINGIFSMVYLMFADKYASIVKYSQNHPEEFQWIYSGFFPSSKQQDDVDLIVAFASNFINDIN